MKKMNSRDGVDKTDKKGRTNFSRDYSTSFTAI